MLPVRYQLLITAVITSAVCTAAPVDMTHSFSGAHTSASMPAPTGTFRIVASFYPVYITVRNIVKDVPGVSVTALTPADTGCLHHYHLTPDDLVRLTHADVLVINGAGMEPFLDMIARRLPELPVIDTSRGIRLIDGPRGPNPHVWVSPSLAISQTWTIAAGLARQDPARAAAYRQNAAAYAGRLASLRERMVMELQTVTNRAIVTFHNAFDYFARDCGLDVVAVVQPEADAQPSAREMARTIATIRAKGVNAIFAEPQYPAGVADAIARETAARVYVLDPAASGPPADAAYIETMQQNLRTLREALH